MAAEEARAAQDEESHCGEQRQHPLVQRGIAAGDDRAALVAGAAAPIRDHAACRVDDRDQRLHVVGVQRRLDHDVDQPHGQQAIAVAVAAPAAQAHFVRDAIEGVVRLLGPEHAGVGGGEHRVGKRSAAARREPSPLGAAPPPRLAARRRRERLADERLVRDAGHHARAVVQRDQRRPVQLAEDEAARAVDRVDDPRVVRRPLFPAVLLAADAVIRIRARDPLADQRFGRAIGDRHRIVGLAALALVGDVERDAKMRQDRGARRRGQLAGELRVGAVLARAHRLQPRGTMVTPASFSCASISDAMYLSPNPSRFALTSVWWTASPTIAETGSDSARCV